ncbi:MAG: carboxymuconolactone decarboxylase family protein [Parahaliea sp.]
MNDLRLPPGQLTQGLSVGGPMDKAIAGFAAAVVRIRDVDPLLRELVRLRCAQIHDCRLCGSLRFDEALEAGFDEDMQRKIARYESSDFSPPVKVALRLCDAIIMTPSLADDNLRADLQQHFSDSQITSLCLDVMKWSQQKVLVALRMEAPPWETTTTLSFDAEGNPAFGKPAYS